jgi:hypothetical protein
VTIVKEAWLAQEQADVYGQPSLVSSVKRTFHKGEEFSLLTTVDRDEKRWIRIRDGSGAVGFIQGEVIIVTEDSLIEGIGRSVGKGASEEEIVTAFAEKGIPKQVIADGYAQVQAAVDDYKDSPEGKALASKYARHMLYGALWAIGGGIATAIGYSSASGSPGGGSYYVFWGAIIFGIYDFFKGLDGWSKYSKKG